MRLVFGAAATPRMVAEYLRPAHGPSATAGHSGESKTMTMDTIKSECKGVYTDLPCALLVLKFKFSAQRHIDTQSSRLTRDHG
jgi:hypothetical protein